MQIPNLPTDNLYKFVALVGFVLVLATIFISFMVTERFVERGHDYQATLESVILIRSELNDSLRAQIEASSKKNRDLSPKKSAYDQREIDDVFAKSQIAKRNLDHIERQMKAWDIAFIVFLVIGIAMQFVGFSLWYSRSQRYQDELLRLQVIAARRSKRALLR